MDPPVKLQRLNYIGSKYNLLEWITETIRHVTGWEDFTNRRIADAFAGTGIVSYHFRTLGSIVLSNDAELYSSIIARAMTTSVYTPRCQQLLESLNAEGGSTVGYITTHYSPHAGNARMFFTEDNAKRIDFLRQRIEEHRAEEEYTFLLASLLVSADNVSNVPAVYGCYLKSFKPRAIKSFQLIPVHTSTVPAVEGSLTTQLDVVTTPLGEGDLLYLDPPYNERQYSKNYFPLNIIAKTPEALLTEPPLKGKTGIPTDCFLSPFCRRGGVADTAFDTLFRDARASWICLSYSSEGLVSKERMIQLMEQYGTVTVVEREYKRFKSFEYNEKKPVTEYLFCLHKV